jgi:hypothetical protein
MTEVFRVYAIHYGSRDARRGQHFHGIALRKVMPAMRKAGDIELKAVASLAES